VPDQDVSNVKPQLLTAWQQIQAQVQQFWKAWSREYLLTLQQRNKWRSVKAEMKVDDLVDDLVLVKEDGLPPTAWSVGRITEVHPGPDGHVRAVTVRTAEGT